MRQLNRSFGALTILNRFSAFLLAQLHGNPKLTDVTTVAQTANDALYSALQASWAAQKNTMVAASARENRKYALDAALRTLRTAILVGAGNDRRSNLYRAVFPDGFAAVVGMNAADEVVEARNILLKLAEFQTPDLAPVTAGVQAGVDGLTAALSDHQVAQGAEQAASGALDTAKVSYCYKYGEIYHQVVLALGERRLAETYFRHIPPSPPVQSPAQPQPVGQPVPQSVPQPNPVTRTQHDVMPQQELTAQHEAIAVAA